MDCAGLIADSPWMRSRLVRAIVNDTGFLYTTTRRLTTSRASPVHLQSPTPALRATSRRRSPSSSCARGCSARALPAYPGTRSRRSRQPRIAARTLAHRALARRRRRLEGRAHCAGAAGASIAEERLIGPVFARERSRRRSPGARVDCPVFEGGFAAVEAEIVICVGARRAARQGRLDARRSGGAWSASCASASRSRAARSRRSTISAPARSVSDFGNNWGVIVGPAVRDWRDAARGHRAEASSTTSSSAAASPSIRHGPLGALAFTLGKCARRGRPLRAGDVISTGMITGVHDIRAGPALAPRVRGLAAKSAAAQCARHRIRSAHEAACG